VRGRCPRLEHGDEIVDEEVRRVLRRRRLQVLRPGRRRLELPGHVECLHPVSGSGDQRHDQQEILLGTGGARNKDDTPPAWRAKGDPRQQPTRRGHLVANGARRQRRPVDFGQFSVQDDWITLGHSTDYGRWTTMLTTTGTARRVATIAR
jgi:hypothetical protein